MRWLGVINLTWENLQIAKHIIGSAEALPILCVRYFRWERERERERRKWRHHFRAKIGDEFTLSLAKNSHNWQWAYTFPCQKFALFVSPFTLPVSPFTERSPLWRWNSQWVHTFHCQKFFRPLCSRKKIPLWNSLPSSLRHPDVKFSRFRNALAIYMGFPVTRHT